MNEVTLQFRKFVDLDRNGKAIGDIMLGYSIFDDYEEIINPEYSEGEEWQDFLSKSPQEILDEILNLYEEKFAASILGTGFYINKTWYPVDETGQILEYQRKEVG